MLTKERKGEIALLFLKRKMRSDGVRVGPNVKREIPTLAKELDIPEVEISEFFELMVRELVDETFKK